MRLGFQEVRILVVEPDDPVAPALPGTEIMPIGPLTVGGSGSTPSLGYDLVGQRGRGHDRTSATNDHQYKR